MNQIIAKLPETIPTAHVISSAGCTHKGDRLHFNSAGYREFGKRYAVTMLLLLGYQTAEPLALTVYDGLPCARPENI